MSPARILIVEDERIVAKALARQLQRLGYTVVAIAGSAQEAIHDADAFHPDLVLMDVGLPGPIDGLEAAARICAQRPIPIVYLSGYEASTALEGVKASEPQLYLRKPITEQALAATLARALRSTPQPPA